MAVAFALSVDPLCFSIGLFFVILGESRLSVPRFVPFADEIILEVKFYDQQLSFLLELIKRSSDFCLTSES